MSPSPPVMPALAFAAAAVAFLTAGCGGGPSSPGIASIAGSTTPATTRTQSAPNVGGSAQGGNQGPRSVPHFQIAMKVGNAVQGAKFSACMRKHGVPNFPDPNSQGVIQMSSGMGFDPTSPAFQSARRTCQKLLPNGGQPTPAQLAKAQQQLLAFSACMRAHGIEDFPDPSNGGLQIHVHPGSDLVPNNPAFQKAQRACQKDLPFKPGGP